MNNTSTKIEARQHMNLTVHVQIALEDDTLEIEEPPAAEQFKHWAEHVWHQCGQADDAVEVTIRLVENQEMQLLNNCYRDKNTPTNVLAFALNDGESLAGQPALLGDIVICADVVSAEAVQQKKSVQHHYAHMVTHGMLHLLGYDHQDPEQADIMEAEECRLLSDLDIANPYQE